MPTHSLIPRQPPFPSNLPLATLPLISFSKLLQNDPSQHTTLFESSRALGFFLLDLNGSVEGELFLSRAERMFEINEEVHELEEEELGRFAYRPPASLFGYKKAGRDDIFGVSPLLKNPDCIEKNRAEIKEYMKQAHEIVELICKILDEKLGLKPGTLAGLQDVNKVSGTHLRMLRGLPQPKEDRRTSLLGHTDIGSLTILFNITGGLQLLTPDTDPTLSSSWKWIKPLPGCAIVNLGDAMVEWSGGILRSNMHRVTYAPGEQGDVTRYSLAYLARPYGDAPMKRLGAARCLITGLEDGEKDNEMREWEEHKAVAIMAGRDNARSRGGKSLASVSGVKEGIEV